MMSTFQFMVIVFATSSLCLLHQITSSFSLSTSDSATSHKLYLCLHNCALCVRHWEAGLYNGEKCAKKCLRFKSNPRIVDPDCNSLKLFNYKVIKRRIKRLQYEQERLY